MLPVNPTAFIGREQELQQAAEVLSHPECRLLTILAPGGMGKTRLALQLTHAVRRAFRHGIALIDLQPIQTADLLLPTLAESLGFTITGSESALAQLAAYVRDKQLLLVFDNFEHVLEGASTLSLLLRAAPEIKMLVTSREALRLQEEHIFTLGGLSVPDEQLEAAHSDAVQLFLTRARQVRHNVRSNLTDVVTICRLVEGSPLAIELAAGWAKVLEVDDILRELRTCLDFLATDLRNIPERHRSMRAVFQGSWERLTSAEQTILKRLAVFQSGFDRAAAEKIATTDRQMLSALRDKALVTNTPEGRWGMHELIRQYAREALERDPIEAEAAYQAHCAYYVERTQRFSILLCGSHQVQALDEMQQDLPNIRAAWHWTVKRGDSLLIERCLLGLTLFYQMQSRTQEVLELFTLSSEDECALVPLVSAQLRMLQGWLMVMLGRNQEGVERLWTGLNAMPTDKFPVWFGLVLVPLIHQPELLGERAAELDHMVEAALKLVQDPWGRAWLLKASGEIALVGKHYSLAIAPFKASAALFESVGDAWSGTWAYGSLGETFSVLQHYDDAESYFLKCIDICRDIGDTAGWIDLCNKLAINALAQGRYAYAEEMLHTGFDLVLRSRTSAGKLTFLTATLVQLRIAQTRHADAVELLAMLIETPYVQHGWREPEIAALQEQLTNLRPYLLAGAFSTAVQQGRTTDIIAKARTLIANEAAHAHSIIPQSTVLAEPLTKREQTILRLIVAGKSNLEIAEALILAIGTVKTHTHHIYEKLGVNTRAQAIARAHELQLV